MSQEEIAAIPQSNTIQNNSCRSPYRQIIKILPNLVNIINSTNPNLTPELRQAKLDRITAIIDANLTIIRVAVMATKDADPIFTPVPDSGPVT